MTDVITENRKLKERLTTMTAEAAANEKIMRKYQQRELELLSAASLEELFEQMVSGLSDSFVLEAVTLVLRDPQHEIRRLLINTGIDRDVLKGILFVDTLDGLTPTYATLRRPWLGPYVGGDHQLIFPTTTGLRSVALLPLVRHAEVTGCMNFGSTDSKRFTRYHATDFLHHLAVIVAFCLENAVNRERLIHAGLRDSLTGWHNRRYFESRMQEAVSASQRYFQPLSCLMIDIDHFKSVNDEHGHQAGDCVLREVADRIKGQVRSCDVAVRYGGEEFVVLLPGTGLEDATRLAERIRGAVSSRPISFDETALTATISIGAACAKPGKDDPTMIGERLVGDADEALYCAKNDGRDRVRTVA